MPPRTVQYMSDEMYVANARVTTDPIMTRIHNHISQNQHLYSLPTEAYARTHAQLQTAQTSTDKHGAKAPPQFV